MSPRPTNTNEGANGRCRGIDKLDRAFDRALFAVNGAHASGGSIRSPTGYRAFSPTVLRWPRRVVAGQQSV